MSSLNLFFRLFSFTPIIETKGDAPIGGVRHPRSYHRTKIPKPKGRYRSCTAHLLGCLRQW